MRFLKSLANFGNLRGELQVFAHFLFLGLIDICGYFTTETVSIDGEASCKQSVDMKDQSDKVSFYFDKCEPHNQPVRAILLWYL